MNDPDRRRSGDQRKNSSPFRPGGAPTRFIYEILKITHRTWRSTPRQNEFRGCIKAWLGLAASSSSSPSPTMVVSETPTLYEPSISDPEAVAINFDGLFNTYSSDSSEAPTPVNELVVLPSGSVDSLKSDLPKGKSSRSLSYSSFLIPKNGQPAPLPKTKRLSRWGRSQLWFNTYR